MHHAGDQLSHMKQFDSMNSCETLFSALGRGLRMVQVNVT